MKLKPIVVSMAFVSMFSACTQHDDILSIALNDSSGVIDSPKVAAIKNYIATKHKPVSRAESPEMNWGWYGLHDDVEINAAMTEWTMKEDSDYLSFKQHTALCF